MAGIPYADLHLDVAYVPPQPRPAAGQDRVPQTALVPEAAVCTSGLVPEGPRDRWPLFNRGRKKKTAGPCFERAGPWPARLLCYTRWKRAKDRLARVGGAVTTPVLQAVLKELMKADMSGLAP